MCNNWCIDFAKNSPSYIDKNAKVLEVGSCDVNGSIRSLFDAEGIDYTGVDIQEGPGVDKIVNAENLVSEFGQEVFDVVISTEMLEHCFDWQKILYQLTKVLKKNGILILTTRSPGFEWHDYPADYWRFTLAEFEYLFSQLGSIKSLESDLTLGWACGVGVIVKKEVSDSYVESWYEDIKKISVYSMEEEKDNSEMESMGDGYTFDQYSRYSACSKIIKEIPDIENILDVGSGPSCLLGKFLPEEKISYIDPIIESDNKNPNAVKDSFFAMNSTEEIYDCICSVDTLEHVPVNERKDFIDKVSNSAKKAIVICFPYSDETTPIKTDICLSDAYYAARGISYPWLEEHFKFGLPKKSEIKQQLEALGWKVQEIGHGYTPWIQEFLSSIIMSWDIEELKPEILKICKIFNEQLCEYDFNGPSYRFFLIATKTDSPIDVSKFTKPMDDFSANTFSLIMTKIQSLLLEYGFKHQKNYTKALGELDFLKKVESELVKEKDQLLSNVNIISNELENQINQKNQLFLELEGIKNSKSWKLTQKIKNFTGPK
jgi:O-antigen biosynthesis protein